MLHSPPAGSPRRSAGLQTSRPLGKRAATGGLVPPGQYFQRTRRLKNIAPPGPAGRWRGLTAGSVFWFPNIAPAGRARRGRNQRAHKMLSGERRLRRPLLCDLFGPGMILATATRTLLAREGTRGLLFLPPPVPAPEVRDRGAFSRRSALAVKGGTRVVTNPSHSHPLTASATLHR